MWWPSSDGYGHDITDDRRSVVFDKLRNDFGDLVDPLGADHNDDLDR